MVCTNCGTQLADGTTFCPNCGAQQAPVAPVQPVYGYQPVPQAVKQPGKGLAVASLVLGILSFFISAVISGTLAIVFGGVAKSKGYRGGMATAGIVCGVIGVALWLLLMIALDTASSMLFSF